jgi:hypothetical protein
VEREREHVTAVSHGQATLQSATRGRPMTASLSTLYFEMLALAPLAGSVTLSCRSHSVFRGLTVMQEMLRVRWARKVSEGLRKGQLARPGTTYRVRVLRQAVAQGWP